MPVGAAGERGGGAGRIEVGGGVGGTGGDHAAADLTALSGRGTLALVAAATAAGEAHAGDRSGGTGKAEEGTPGETVLEHIHGALQSCSPSSAQTTPVRTAFTLSTNDLIPLHIPVNGRDAVRAEFATIRLFC